MKDYQLVALMAAVIFASDSHELENVTAEDSVQMARDIIGSVADLMGDYGAKKSSPGL